MSNELAPESYRCSSCNEVNYRIPFKTRDGKVIRVQYCYKCDFRNFRNSNGLRIR